MVRAAGVFLLALAALAGCAAGPAAPAPSDTIDYTGPPHWDDLAEFETELTFADGAALAGTRVEFRNGLGSIYDWVTVGTPTDTTVEFANVNAGCRVTDERGVYAGGAPDDETASRDLVVSLLGAEEIIGGPQPGIEGLEEGLGEGGPTYDVMIALAEPADGGYVFVTGRVFVALGVQHARTVRCELGGYLDRTRAQLASVAFAHLAADENAAVPACLSDALEIAYFAADGALGDITGTLRFRNIGPTVCGLPGYPVVQLTGSDGVALGPPATPDPDDAPVPIGILPDGAAFAFVTVVPSGDCTPAPIDALIVTPPIGDTATGRLVATAGLRACTDGVSGRLVIGGPHP